MISQVVAFGRSGLTSDFTFYVCSFNSNQLEHATQNFTCVFVLFLVCTGPHTVKLHKVRFETSYICSVFLLDVVQMLFKVSCASVPCRIYLLKVLVTHGKLSRWCIHSIQTHMDMHLQACIYTHTTWWKELSRLGPLCILGCSLFTRPPFLPQLYALSLCLPISGHGRLLFRHFKQI